MSDPSTEVSCPTHGDSHAAYVCRHLARREGDGFFCAEGGKDPRPDAWCAGCQEILEREGEWNEASEKFAGVSLICAGCYDDIRAEREGEPGEDGGLKGVQALAKG